MASKKKKKKSFSEQVISGTYESSLTKDKVSSALKSNSRSVADAYKQYKKTEDTSGSIFSAFEDGYDVGDITKSLLKGTSKLGETIYNTGKEIVTNPIESVKTGGVGIASGMDRADTLINNATEDFFTWISPWRDKEDNKGLTLKEFNQLSSATDEKTKKKLLKEYAEKYGKDSATYKTIELQLETKPRDTGTYKDTETYKKAQEGKLSEGQQNIYGVGENIGAMIPSVGVSMVAGPVAGSSVFFVQAQQGYTEEAKERGYSDTEARTYGIIMGTAEVVVERLGFDELGGMGKLSNGSIIKAMGGEALEEAVMPYVEDVVTYGIYEDGYSWEEFGESTEESLKGAVMGATVGAIMRAGGKGLTQVDALIQKAENGQQVTQDDINRAIEELKEKDPGYIEQYIEEGINVVREQNATMNQHTTSAQENLQDIAPVQETVDTTEIDDIAPVVAQEVLKPTLVSGQDVRVAGQQDIAPVEAPAQDNRYTYTPQETDSKYKQAVSKSAETVGLENNASTQTMIDLASKVSERTGKQILFTNEAQPEMLTKRQGLINSYAKANNISVEEATAKLQGITINGLTDGNTILINTDSNGYLNVIVGHEITHTFENTGKLYDELQDAVFKYASEIGEFEAISDKIARTYEGQNANLNKELTSELVGRYLFTDQAFINGLKSERPNLFQRIYNEIKHLIKMATAGSEEARALEEVKYRFEKAMNKVASEEISKATVQESKTKSTTERLSNTEKEYSLEKGLEKDLEKKLMDKKAQIDFFEDYLKEEGIKNPTEKDMYDSWGTYEQADANVDGYVEAEKEYYKTIREYLSKLDNLGRELSEEQIEFFKDSVVRDEEGRLLTMYHGTRADFNVFESDRTGQNYEDNWSRAGKGYYFTPDKKVAKDYGEASIDKGEVKIKEAYLNITNPFDMSTDYTETLSNLKTEYNIDDFYLKVGYRLIDWFKSQNIDSTEVLKKNGFDGIHDFDDYVAFESNQIKDVNNKKPTLNEDIRYSLSILSDDAMRDILLTTRNDISEQALKKTRKQIAEERPDFFSKKTDNLGRKLSKGMQDFMEDSKARDVNDSLSTVYHTMTDEGIQFNEFNPVGTNYYRYGDQVVNFYTDSKVMSGSYADQRYETSDTKKLNNLEEAKQWLEENVAPHLTENKVEIIEMENGKYGVKYTSLEYDDVSRIVTYNDLDDLLRNIKREHTRGKKYANFQYEGYVNITNPYVVDAEGRSWGQVRRSIDEKRVNEALNLTEQQKADLIDLQIQSEKEYYNHLDKNRDFEYLQTALKSLPEMEQYNVIMDLPLDEPKAEMKYYNWVSSLMVETREEFAKKYRAGMEDYYTYKTPDTYFYNELNRVYNQEYLEPAELYQLASMRFEDSGQSYGREYYENRYQKNQTTNDVVKQVIEMNKNGSNYDGVIMKNVVDYGGSANGDYSPANLYVTFNSEQFKAWDNENPTSDADIRYSLDLDNYGNKINPGLLKWSENSKARNQYGLLERLYHGSAMGEFTVFDKNKANPEGDWGAGFYLTNNKADVEGNYSGGGADFHQKVSRLAEQIEQEEEISYNDAYTKAHNQLYKGQYTITSYVNIENPAIVGETYLFSGYEENYNIDDFESEEEYQEAVDQLVADDIDTAIWGIENTYDFYNGTEEIRSVLWEAYYNGGMEIQELKDKLNELYLETDEGFVANDVARIIIESQGYDGIIDPTVNEKAKKRWNMDLHGSTTHYIVFKPNQIKNISNENPTDNPDINMSLSKEGEELAPIGDFNIKGSDVRLQKQVEKAIAPLKEEIETLTKTITDLQEDIAPASFESAEEQRAETQRTMTDEDAPLTDDGEFIFTEEVPITVKGKDKTTREIADNFNIKYTEARELYNKVANTENPTVEDVFDILSEYRNIKMQMDLDEVNAIQSTIKGTRIDVSEFKNQITDYKHYRISNMGKGLIIGNSGEKVDSVYQELNEMYGDNAFPSSVTAEVDQLDIISQWLYKNPYLEYTDTIDDDSLYDLAEKILIDVGNAERYKTANAYQTNWFRHYKDDILAPGEAPRIKTEISQEDYLKSLPDGLTDDYAPYLEMAREVNASNTENTSDIAPIGDILDRLSIKPKEEVIEAQNEEEIVKTPRVTKKKPGVKSAYGTIQELIFNDTYQIDKLAKETNRPSIKHNNYMLKGVYGEIPGDILVGQTDNYGNKIGKSVKELWQPAHDSGLFNQFNDRMKHQLNIERWKTNKPLWFEIPAEASQEIVKAYDETYPKFKEWAKDIYKFYENSLDNKFEAGLVNEAQRKLLREELYPSYVRIDVEQLEKPYVDITPGEIRSKAPLKRAVGGSGELAMTLEESMVKSVYADKMGIRQNKLYLEIAKALQDNRAEVGADVRQELADMSEALYLDADTGKYYLTAYENGEQFTVEIGADLYNGLKNDLKQTLKNIETRLGKPLELVQKAGNLKRDLTTTYNPFFWLTNPPKDFFDGLINSKHVGGFAKNYIPAWKEAITNTGDAPQFRALYGSAMDMGDYSAESGLGDTEGKFTKWAKNTKLLRGINKLNEITEVATRLAEFKASKEAGASLEEAMYNAREVTVNFDRGGTVTKFLDRNGFKFLNVSAQGFDKFIRNFSGQEGARATMGAWARAVAFGIAPALVNHLLFGGGGPDEDEEYEALPDYIKDNYFLFKMDDGTFVRIPKGRMMAVFGSAGRRTLEFLGGEEDAYEGFLENSESQVGMANPFDNFLLAPIIQAYGSENGTTWYGEELIPSRLQDKAPEEQYDASTDKASIFLGELFGISPYKLNYVIDQYSGGIGDLVLPMITEETKTDGSLMAPFIDKFTANSTDDNKYASEIYALGDKRDKVPTAEKETDLYKIQDAYLYSITSEMGELYAEKREVQADSSLSKSEKYAKVQEIQDQINSLAKEGLDNYEYISQKENYAIVGGREFNKYTAEDGTERWGTPWEDELSDLNSMGMDLAEKNNYFTSKKSITEINDYYKDLIDSASEEEKDEIYAERKRDVIKVVQDTDLNDEMKAYLYNKYYSSDKTKVITTVGIDFDAYLDFESQQFEADKDSAGKSISGSKKAKVFAYINSMNLDFEERLILAKLQYNSYDTYNAEIINYLNSNSDISYDEEVEILKKLGFTVDANGRIYWE